MDVCPTGNDIIKKCPRLPYQFGLESSRSVAKAPLIGGDNLNFYEKELGFSKEKLEELSSKGII